VTQVFNWPSLLSAGLGRMGLSPEAFWQMTPYEFQLLMGQSKTFAPLDRRRLVELVEKYPDQREEVKNE
jgi:uncharacterized phage protein (TIGR02216 family)